MELKQYQRRVMGDLRKYLNLIRREGDYQRAFATFWAERGVQTGEGGMRGYHEDIPGVPHVCFKVPTGGGKTFLAANSVKPLMEHLPGPRIQAVVWLVPSDSILSQTLEALKNPDHPYRQQLDADFGGRVAIYSKDEAMMGQNFNPVTVSEQLSVLVLSYDSFRAARTDWLRAYQQNSAMMPFYDAFRPPDKPIEGADKMAFFQIVNQFNPVVIVDESHHAKSKLSVDMLHNFNPAFVLELTATPHKRSNVISYVEAAALKQEHMVKLPVIVYNRTNGSEVVTDAIDLRKQLEAIATASHQQGGAYIRPIVLFQAQQRGKENAATYDKLKKDLIKAGIPAEQIAIKTASINELDGIDLLSPACPIRYIITINALKEGWDCPFAYILATVANRSSQVDVEQVLGRILRQPHATLHERKELNLSYVFTSSDDFSRTLDRVIEGMQAAGFSAEDYRVGSGAVPASSPEPSAQDEAVQDDFFDLIPEVIRRELDERERGASPWKVESGTQTMLEQAVKQAEAYDREIARSTEEGAAPPIPAPLRDYVTQYPMQAKYRQQAAQLRLPQFIRVEEEGVLTSGRRSLLDKENLLEGFRLAGKPYDIDFSQGDVNLYKVDVEGSRVYKAQLTGQDASAFKGMFLTGAPERQSDRCKAALLQQLEHLNGVTEADLKHYIAQIVDAMDKDQLAALEKGLHSAAARIEERVNALMAVHQQKKFRTWLEQGRIICEESYQLPATQSPVRAITTMGKSLYEGEHGMNQLEQRLVEAMAALPNIVWWHRNPSQSGFRINGYVNHYPDIIAFTSQGRVLVIETKGDYNRNADDAIWKQDQGIEWASKAGEHYRFYMVVESKETAGGKAYPLHDFLKLAEGL